MCAPMLLNAEFTEGEDAAEKSQTWERIASEKDFDSKLQESECERLTTV
jgi:hypothetical protein